MSVVIAGAIPQLNGSTQRCVRLSCTISMPQGPGKRPAVFSHDKLVWELQQDAVRAANAEASPCMPAIAPPYVPLQISALRPRRCGKAQPTTN